MYPYCISSYLLTDKRRNPHAAAMSKTPNRNVSALGPQNETSNGKITTPSSYAGGTPAVSNALQHSLREMGMVKAFKGLASLNQKKGFDCPSCAWPDPDTPNKVAEYCENGAKALADEATRNTLDAQFFAQHSVEALSLRTDFELNQLGRLTEPLVLHPDKKHYEPISWEDAYHLISKELKGLGSPDEAIFYTSGRSSNEAAFLYGTFARALGTNNLPDCSNMCHESSGIALKNTLGIGKGSVTLDDFYKAEVVIIAGQNPGTNHPRMLTALEKCKANGGKIISINPLAEAGLVNFKNPQRLNGWLGNGTDLADIHLQVKINQDIALVKLLLKKLFEKDAEMGNTVLDHDFIEKYTEGYTALKTDLDRYDVDELLDLCGISKVAISKTVDLLAAKSKIIICWAMGLTQHKNGVANIQEFVNLLLLKGAIGKPNAGTCPVRGHSNVQGDRSVGIRHYVDEGYNERLKTHLGFEAPTKPGYDTVESIKAMHDKKTKVFMCLGGNFLSAASDTEFTAEAIQNCNLTIQVSTKLNRSHLVTGKTALMLPTLGRSEKDQNRFVTTENSMGKVRWSQGIFRPISGNLKSEPDIIAELGHHHFGENHPVPWKKMGTDYTLIREAIDNIAKGFKNTEQQSKDSGYYLPNSARAMDFSGLPNGKAQFTVNPLPEHELKANEFLLMTIRSHDQFNTTIYGMDDRYRGVYGTRRVLMMNEKDMAENNIRQGTKVNVLSHYDGTERKALNFKVISYNIPRGNLAAYFPETNVLVPYNHFADKSQTPISKSVKVTVEKS